MIQKSYYQSASGRLNFDKKITSNLNNMLKEQYENVHETYEEPGFNLTDSEMIKFKIWPKGVVPYYIDILSFSDKVLRDRIRSFLNNVNGVTSLNFVELPSPPKDDTTRWVFFVNRRGQLKCADPHVKDFTNEGVQHVVLGYECLNDGGALAEAVLALVGVPAQHNAPDRDNYIKVNIENVAPDKINLYTKFKDDEWLFHDVSYDFTSAGHYDFYRHSANGRATFSVPNQYPHLNFEQSSLSTRDILKIRMLYNFVAKKKSDFPECHKLFEPGADFDKIDLKRKHVEPRKKPIRYLGILEVENQEQNNSNNKDEHKVDDKDLEVEENDQESQELRKNESNKKDNLSPGKPVSLKGKALILNKHHPFLGGPLETLSDFNTEEYE